MASSMSSTVLPRISNFHIPSKKCKITAVCLVKNCMIHADAASMMQTQ